MASCRSTSWAAALKARQPLQVSADLVLHVWVVWQGADDHLDLAVVPPAQDHAPAELSALILWAQLWKHGPRAAHPGLDSFPTSHTKGSAPLVVLEVPMLPIELFSSPMITQAAVFQGYYSKGPAGQTVH